MEKTSHHGACGQVRNKTTGASVPFSKSLQPSNHGACSIVPLQEEVNRETPSISDENSKVSREVSEL
jgi:hypothetical protein